MAASLSRRSFYSSALGVGVGLVYGACARFVFEGQRPQIMALLFAGMSIAFLFLVPLALGALTVYLGSVSSPRKWPYWLFMPWVSCFFLMVGAIALAWEGAVCIVMAAPIFFFMSSLGGLIVGLVVREGQPARPPVVAALALLPFLLSPAEQRVAPPVSVREMHTAVVVAADAQTVWRNLARVPEIRESEQRASVFRLIGIPKPLEATLSRDGLGALREARFEGGIRFHETVTEWAPGEALGFDIRVDPTSIGPTVLDRHVKVGGEYFDVLHGRFRIEPAGEGKVVLHLDSRYRVSTRFNAYSGLWTDAVMRDLQRDICRIIKDRSESRLDPPPIPR